MSSCRDVFFFNSRHDRGGRTGSTAQQHKRCVDASAELLERVPWNLEHRDFVPRPRGISGMGKAEAGGSARLDAGLGKRAERMEARSHAFCVEIWGIPSYSVGALILIIYMKD